MINWAIESNNGMIVLAEYPLKQILPLIGFGKPNFSVVINRKYYSVKCSSVRLECFKRNQNCVICKAQGNWWRLEQHKIDYEKGNNPNFSLYDKLHKPILLMTKDHIIPKSKGGGEEIENMQTMCYPCNQKKGPGPVYRVYTQ